METTVKREMFFSSEANATEVFRQSRFESPLYNLIRFNYFNGERRMYYYLVTSSTLMTVICEASTYLGMLARFSCRKFGYEPVDNGYSLVGIELIDM